MVNGTIHDDLIATVPIELVTSAGESRQLEAMLDTGFNGFLTLPFSMIEELGLRRRGLGRAILADGTLDLFDIFEAEVIWDSMRLTVEVDATSAGVLLGMSLLHGYHLSIPVQAGRRVDIQRMD